MVIRNFFIAGTLAVAMLMGAAGCAKKSETVYYQEWHIEWLTPKGTELTIIGDLYKPIQKAQNKQFGIYVSEANGTPTTIQYPILQKTITGKWVVVANGYDKKMMQAEYVLMPDHELDSHGEVNK